MPLPILLAHRLAARLAEDRQSGAAPWLRPDGKTQVTVQYEDGEPVRDPNVLVSTQHAAGALRGRDARAPEPRARAPGARRPGSRPTSSLSVNPAGSGRWAARRPTAGLTGRKIIVDTYGGMARHGGGAFSGKDPTKVDRSGAYFCRWVARQVVEQGIGRARRGPGGVRHRPGRAGVGGRGHLRHGRRRCGQRSSSSGFDFRPAAIDRAAGADRDRSTVRRRTTATSVVRG